MSGTYHLWELASTRAEVHTLAQQVVEELSLTDGSPITADSYDEPSQALVYMVHQQLWNDKSRVEDTTRPPYTHKVKGPNMSRALRHLVPDVQLMFSEKHKFRQLVSGIYAVLSGNQLLSRLGKNSSNNMVHFIKEWPAGFVPQYKSTRQAQWLSRRDERDVRRQQRRAIELAGEVTTTFDLSLIPMPDPDPESVLQYLRRVIPLAKRLQEDNDKLRLKLKEFEQSRWSGVTDELKDLLS